MIQFNQLKSTDATHKVIVPKGAILKDAVSHNDIVLQRDLELALHVEIKLYRNKEHNHMQICSVPTSSVIFISD